MRLRQTTGLDGGCQRCSEIGIDQSKSDRDRDVAAFVIGAFELRLCHAHRSNLVYEVRSYDTPANRDSRRRARRSS